LWARDFLSQKLSDLVIFYLLFYPQMLINFSPAFLPASAGLPAGQVDQPFDGWGERLGILLRAL
jgi:hypothetical protein